MTECGARIGSRRPRGGWSYLAGALAGVERLIGARKELFGALAHLVLLPPCGEADGNSVTLPVHFQGAQTIQNELQLLQGAFGKKNKEFVAAEANGKIRATDDSIEVGGKLLQHLVPGRVAVLVVDQLEIVQIEREHSQGMSPALGACHLRGEALHSKTTIVEARQRINHGEIAQNLGMAMFFGELEAQSFNEDLLIDGVHVEDYYEDDQAKDCVADFDVEKRFQSLMQGWKRKGNDRKGEQEHHKDRISPGPPIPSLDLAELLRQLLIAGLDRRWKGVVLGVSHRVGVKDSATLLILR